MNVCPVKKNDLMKIVFFGTQPYDRDSFDRISGEYAFQIEYTESHLNIGTVSLASGADAVCIFVNDTADAETIGASAAYEIMVNGGGRAAWDALTEKAPQITKGMLDAAEREGAPLTHKMMQGAFDGWYKNPAVMRIYEDSYMMTECLGGSCDSRNDPRNYFKREMSSKEMVSAFCLDAEGKGYQSDRPNVLDEPERLQVQQKVLDMAKSVNENRRINGLTPDYSYRNLYLWGEAPKTVEKASNQAVLNAVAAKKMSR